MSSETIQLVVVGAILAVAAIFLFRRWSRPKRPCDRCPPEAPPLVKLGRRKRDGR